MNKQFYCLFLLFVVLFSACEEDIDLDLSGNKKLVLLSTFQADSLLQVYLSTSVPVANADSFQAHYPENAKIQLYENGQYLDDFTFAFPINQFIPHYTIDYRPKTGSSYSIKAQYADYPPCQATTRLLSAPIIESVELKDLGEATDPYNPRLNYYFAKVQMTFNATEAGPHYFHLLARQEVAINGPFGLDTLQRNLPIILSEIDDLELTLEGGNLFQVEQIPSGGIQADLELDFIIDYEYELKGPLVFELRRVTRDYFLFYKTLEEQEVANFRQSVLFDEPVLIHHNIVGGLGHFSGYTAKIETLNW